MKSKVEILNNRALNLRLLLKKVIFLFEIALYLLSFVGSIYFIDVGSGTKAVKCIIIVSLLLIYRFIQLIFNIKLSDLLKLSVLIFIFMAMFLAETLDFYSKIPIFDKILHSFSGAMLFFLGQALFKRVDNTQKNFQSNTHLMILFGMFFSIAMAGCWEIFEFTLDRLMGYHLQNDSLFDTMGDIICGTSMGIISGMFSFVLYRTKKVNIAKKCFNDDTLEGYFEMKNIEETSNLR